MTDVMRADYERLEQIAYQFTSQALAIEQMMQNVRDSIDSLENGWVGRGSSSFFSEMQSEVLPANDRLQQALDEASRVTKQIIQTIKQAEEEASSPFRTQ